MLGRRYSGSRVSARKGNRSRLEYRITIEVLAWIIRLGITKLRYPSLPPFLIRGAADEAASPARIPLWHRRRRLLSANRGAIMPSNNNVG